MFEDLEQDVMDKDGPVRSHPKKRMRKQKSGQVGDREKGNSVVYESRD